MAAIPTVTISARFRGRTLTELLDVRKQINAAQDNRISGLVGLSRGGTSSTFAHLSSTEISRLQYDLALALHELAPNDYAHPGNRTARKVF